MRFLDARRRIDLDNKINVNAGGNNRGTDPKGLPLSLSTHGYGPWEIDLSKVLTGGDWHQLLVGNGYISGRYGPDRQPGANGQFLQGGTGVPPPYWSALDLDGGQNPAGGPPPLNPTSKYRIPGEQFNGYGNSWYNVGRLKLLRYLTIPAALPYLFSGLRIAAPLSLVGAIIVDLMGAQQGLGYLMLTALTYPSKWPARTAERAMRRRAEEAHLATRRHLYALLTRYLNAHLPAGPKS